ncbi:uncharacterized protein LOC123309880 [Coccinella septempunctata]|uniref:uncharacterized protein LOC123309880 n=1 Tax=Coccinella septempunctata TaxID=41139 RepID=UPI001D08349A|nr:uncharacterized protein LOC123309880 [Coccinella septempunctata]
MASAGFDVVNWTFNSKILRTKFSETSVGVKQIDDSSSLHRVLGLWWDTEKDEFRFKLNLKDIISEKSTTKRIVLRTIMSLFDPVGFISSFTIKAKILMQDIWRTDLNWDEDLNENLLKTWKKWMDELAKIAEVRIPRCYSLQIPIARNIELHTFCDSSEKAFAVVSFLIVVVENVGKIDVSLVSSKIRVAPLKPLSIPKSELQAAVMATRLAQSIKYELDTPIMRMFFWSDSQCVISWIKSDGRKFKQFVAHRIGEIQESTKIEDWRWIPTNLNPADEARRPHIDSTKIISDIWIAGPEFLRKTEEYWPKESTSKFSDSEISMEIKREYINLCSTSTEKRNPLPDIFMFLQMAKTNEMYGLVSEVFTENHFLSDHNVEMVH